MASMPANSKPQTGEVPMQSMPQAAQPVMPQPVQLVSAPQVALGPEPCSMTCPSCGASIVTSIRSVPTTKTHLMALCLCCICIFLTCIPYCVDSCQNADHLCPNCNAYLGTYKR